MGFTQRSPSPIDPAVDPLLPQADSSQAHDIPTGVSPTTAKLQDWISWISDNGVFFSSGTTITSDITIAGDLAVTLTLDVAGAATFDTTVSVGTDLTVGDDLTVTDDLSVGGDSSLTGPVTAGSYVLMNGTQPTSSADPGANRSHSTNLVKAWAAIQFDAGVVTVLDGFNISSASISGINTEGVIVFARDMANANYAITYGCGGVSGARTYATTTSSNKATTGFRFNVWDEAAGAVVDLTNAATDVIVSICVMGRQ